MHQEHDKSHKEQCTQIVTEIQLNTILKDTKSEANYIKIIKRNIQFKFLPSSMIGTFLITYMV